jgi:hypothetical protein
MPRPVIGCAVLLGHYFIVSGNKIIDFSAGDWGGKTQRQFPT